MRLSHATRSYDSDPGHAFRPLYPIRQQIDIEKANKEETTVLVTPVLRKQLSDPGSHII